MLTVVEAYADLARRILDRPARLGRTRLVAVDGPSGAGKSVFAERLAAAVGAVLAARKDPDSTAAAESEPPVGPGLDGVTAVGGAPGPGPGLDGMTTVGAAPGSGPGPEPALAGPPVVHTDDLLDGWADQVSFWPRLDRWVLAPLRAGRTGRYQRYDWTRRAFGAQWIPVPPAPVVVLEGVTAARAVVRPELTCAIFVTAPSALRLERVLARDGSALLPRLRQWRDRERAHFVVDRTPAHADVIVDGAGQVPAAADPGPGTSSAGARGQVGTLGGGVDTVGGHYLRLPGPLTIEQWT